MKTSEIKVGKTYENASGKKRRKVANISTGGWIIYDPDGYCSLKAFSNWAVREVKE